MTTKGDSKGSRQ